MKTLFSLVFAYLFLTQHTDVKNVFNQDAKIKSIKTTAFEAIQGKKGIIPGEPYDHNYAGYDSYLEYREDGHLSEVSNKTMDGQFKNKRTFIYDQKMNIVEIHRFNANDEVIETVEKTFDEKNQLTERKEFDKRNDNMLFFHNVYIYDDNGNLVHLVETGTNNINGRTEYTYDENNNRIEEKEFELNGQLMRKFTYKYDSNGNKIETKSFIYYDRSGNTSERFSGHSSYKYNDNNDMIVSNRHVANGRIDVSWYYTYDSKGFKIEEITKDSSGEITYTEKYIYEFDTNGNWTKKTMIENSKPKYMVIREIEYFN